MSTGSRPPSACIFKRQARLNEVHEVPEFIDNFGGGAKLANPQQTAFGPTAGKSLERKTPFIGTLLFSCQIVCQSDLKRSQI